MLTDLLRRAVDRDGAKTAVICGLERITYRDLEWRVARCAAGLSALGVARGDCVAVVLPNCPEFVVALLATFRLAAIILPLSPLYRRDELERILADAGPRVILADGLRVSVCRDIAASLPGDVAVIVHEVHDAGAGFGDLGADLPPIRRQGPFGGPALYLYTSGSTDAYKRVCCTQENLYFEALNFVETVGLGADDTILCAVPLYHSYGLGNGFLDALYSGATLVLLERTGQDVDPPFGSRVAEVLDLIEREEVRFYPGVPHQFAVLAALPAATRVDLSGVRWCVSSGDVLPPATFHAFRERFGQTIRSLYGSTEAGSISIDTSSARDVPCGSLGLPLRNVQIEIRDAGGQAIQPGEQGAIWVKSPVIPPTLYDNRPILNAARLRDGFYDTGDIGLIDLTGRLVMTGRKQSFVDVGGYKVDLGEVEDVLRACPGVEDVAAVAVNVPHMGLLIKASVVAGPACADAQIRAHCRDRLAFFKVPRLIERRPSLPRSPVGKVLKSELTDVSTYLETISRGASGVLAARILAAPAGSRRPLLERLVKLQFADVLQRPIRDTQRNAGFVDQGLDSLSAVELRARLEYLLGRRLPETVTFDYPTIAALADYLAVALLDDTATPIATTGV